MQDKIISVIVPIYKVERYLRKCIDSILLQTYRNLEVILVEDGSPDNCSDICDEYGEKDNRVKVIHKENGGLSDARNAGIEASKGEYIIFVDSDDYIVPTMIEKMIEALLASNSDLCICNINYVDENGAVINNQNMRSPIKNGIYSRDDVLKFLVNDGYWFYVTAWNKLYKADVFRNIRFRVGKHHEDEFLIHEIIDCCNKVVCLEDRLYYYVQREGSIMNTTYSVKNLDGIEAKVERLLYYIKNKKIEESILLLDNVIDNLMIARIHLGEESTDRIKLISDEVKKVYVALYKQKGIPAKKRIKFIFFLYCEKAGMLLLTMRKKKYNSDIMKGKK